MKRRSKTWVLWLAVMAYGARSARIKNRNGAKHSAQAAGPAEPSSPGLCAPEIVKESCVLLNKGGNGGEVLTANISVHAEEMTLVSQMLQMLSSEEGSMIEVLKEMKAAGDKSVKELYQAMRRKRTVNKTGEMDFVVSCKDMCNAVVRHLATFTALPPASDLGCYEDGFGMVHCDLDLSPSAAKALVKKGSLPDFHAGHNEGSSEEPKPVALEGGEAEQVVEGKAVAESALRPSMALDAGKISYSTRELLRRLANIFRIYPMPDISFDGEQLPDEKKAMQRAGSVRLLNQSRLPAGWEQHKDQTGATYYWHAKLGSQWDRPEELPPGWEQFIARSGRTYYGHPDHGSTWKRPQAYQRPTIKDLKVQDEDNEKSAGDDEPESWDMPEGWQIKKDATGRAYYSKGGVNQWWKPGWVKPVHWKRGVAKRSQQAQSYLNAAIRQNHGAGATSLKKKWFGNTPYVNELTRVLNAVEGMLGNMEVRYPGPDCEDPNVYAYVYPGGTDSDTMNSKGQHIVYLCDFYMKSSLSLQIETLTHEGSHHEAASTKDVCMDEFKDPEVPQAEYMEIPAFRNVPLVGARYKVKVAGYAQKKIVEIMMVNPTSLLVRVDPRDDEDCADKAYGRPGCEELAQKSPVKAIRNADNFCYYVQDITDSIDLDPAGTNKTGGWA